MKFYNNFLLIIFIITFIAIDTFGAPNKEKNVDRKRKNGKENKEIDDGTVSPIHGIDNKNVHGHDDKVIPSEKPHHHHKHGKKDKKVKKHKKMDRKSKKNDVHKNKKNKKDCDCVSL
uniref:Uncharacterized protein n=1 Tax=Parastrongyloides trichosuri TaxID=131310 RepID=A0A0N5A626_PARTI